MAGVTTTFPAAAPEDSAEVARSPVRPSRWERLGLMVLLAATAVMYLWNITVNGMGNQFYAGAAEAGSKNWEALLFGSLDAENFITVDKPPVSQWVMGLSGQLFGFSSASMLVPEALMAVATVWLLYAAITRICGPRAGLLAGAALALTPVAALMFRFNNPDAAMVLLMTACAYCTVRALERAGGKWLAWAGIALGFAFLAKMLEGLMIAPAVGLAYLVAAPTTLRRRLLHLLGAAAAFVVSAGWFVVLTLVWPASSRPYIAGSTDNNFMNLVLGYNGFARVLGRNHLSLGPTDPIGDSAGDQLRHVGGFGGMGNQKEGLSRLFAGEFGFEIGWLIPAALLAVVLVLIARGRAPRTDPVRAGVLLFGGWLLIDGLVLSYMKGMVHPYYCLSLAPAVTGTVAIGAHEMWTRRRSWFGRVGVTALIAVTGIWSWWVLGRNEDWMPALRWTILVGAVLAAVVVALSAPRRRRIAVAAAALGVVAVLAGPAAYAVATLGAAHHGGGPTVGPASAAKPGSGGGFGDVQDNPKLDALLRATTTRWSAAISGSSAAAGLELSTGTAVMAIGGFTGSDPAPSLGQFKADVSAGKVAYYIVTRDWRGRAGGWPGNSRNHSGITDWVTATFPMSKVGDADVYDLSRPK
ncbi:glycosyltransferase family 39 protein [Mycobacterium sp. EPa45]|uniref:ArnT family glycosyltransferase n=1 Tax=Mycobacterium sp. EPa45 TaxID=1545728 RepID=UPI00064192C7|nr:glycosyltransferase family 39 protein [Mycobacterium sp. EPa45]AKK25539.1 mannosyltransferase [Mycobacterium sp. EPa45]